MGGVSGVQDPPRDGEGDRAAQRRGGGGSRSLRRPEVYEARGARRQMSLPEVLLWQRLKGKPQGVAFRNQHPIGGCRADFYCAAAKLVIEVDGIAHDMGERPTRDDARTQTLEAQGYRVLRILATEVLRDPDAVAASVVALASRPLHHSPAASGPPPRAGEDLHA